MFCGTEQSFNNQNKTILKYVEDANKELTTW